MTGLFGAVAEAWGEVRVHKSRVVLSLSASSSRSWR